MTLNDIIYELTGIPKWKYPRPLDGKNGYIYYIRIVYDNIIYYKIGYTARDVEERIRKMFPITGTEINIIDKAYFNRLVDAYQTEQLLHKLHAEHRFKYNFKLHGRKFIASGMKEVYTKDVLNLDTGTYIPKKPIGRRWRIK